MKLSGRLLLTLCFCAFVLPFIVKNFGLTGIKQKQELEEVPLRYEQQYEKTKNDYTNKLLASIERLPIVDTELKQCITKHLSRYFSVGDPSNYIQDAADIQTLLCHRQGIKSLKGIRSLSKLTILHLSSNQIEDASPLSYLSNLETLDLSYGNKMIENIESLQNLNKLTYILFPNLEHTFCYKADKLVKNMEWHHEKITHNLNNIRCRGKKTTAVINALKKRDRKQELSDNDQRLIDDFEENARWSS